MDLHLRRGGGGFLRWSVMIIFMFVHVDNKPNKVVASSHRTSLTLIGPAPSPSPSRPPPMGLCESAVIVHGYQCQEFYVKTEDGYVINMQRISSSGCPRSSGGGGGKLINKQPVLLQHGVFLGDPILVDLIKDKKDGMTWLLLNTQQSLAFILADSGFEVWIANTRGTKFSRQHATLNASQPEYWNWSWDELAEYELSSTFDFIYHQTRQKLHYGTTYALASFSEGKLMDKLKSAALLSPIAYLSHITNPIGLFGVETFLYETAMLVGVEVINPKPEEVANFLNSICEDLGIDCYDLISQFSGTNCCLNASTLELFWKNEPQPTSTKNMVHLSQTIRDGIFSKFDYGNQEMNIENYGQEKPPIYNLSNIPRNLPLFISYGGKDSLSDVEDVEMLLEKLKFHEGDKLTTVFIKDYAHADFIMGFNAKEKVYNPLVSFLRRH